jgi:hypothetical protein
VKIYIIPNLTYQFIPSQSSDLSQGRKDRFLFPDLATPSLTPVMKKIGGMTLTENFKSISDYCLMDLEREDLGQEGGGGSARE